MPVTDQIADMLTRIRNAGQARHDHVLIPTSRMKLELARLLKAEGYIQKFESVDDPAHPGRGQIRITLKYTGRREPVISGLTRVSKPGVRVYTGHDELPRVRGGLGVAILTTSRGVMTDREARRQGIGGEVLCYVW